jgi:hypothetical protein
LDEVLPAPGIAETCLFRQRACELRQDVVSQGSCGGRTQRLQRPEPERTHNRLESRDQAARAPFVGPQQAGPGQKGWVDAPAMRPRDVQQVRPVHVDGDVLERVPVSGSDLPSPASEEQVARTGGLAEDTGVLGAQKRAEGELVVRPRARDVDVAAKIPVGEREIAGPGRGELESRFPPVAESRSSMFRTITRRTSISRTPWVGGARSRNRTTPASRPDPTLAGTA